MQGKLSQYTGRIKSFIAHVAAVGAGVVVAAAALGGVALLAPSAFAIGTAALGFVAVGAVGGYVGDRLNHWAKGDQAAVAHSGFSQHVRYHKAEMGIGA